MLIEKSYIAIQLLFICSMTDNLFIEFYVFDEPNKA
ncbi:hypothetical protein CLOLEP_03007 [[Clostridium] leptum DSM 753]|uniref:Uncharacterized protein n=1 Tax=[Clostridium] leptum DSM 753 TaxID=428125 RepID=A7VWN6_9FIRM|nr:hypothetical protein CLOLEP_03007 [[Clostridium] leptum DSM 753]